MQWLRVAGPMIAARNWRRRLRWCRDGVGVTPIANPTIQGTLPAEIMSRSMASRAEGVTEATNRDTFSAENVCCPNPTIGFKSAT